MSNSVEEVVKLIEEILATKSLSEEVQKHLELLKEMRLYVIPDNNRIRQERRIDLKLRAFLDSNHAAQDQDNLVRSIVSYLSFAYGAIFGTMCYSKSDIDHQQTILAKFKKTLEKYGVSIE